MTSFGETLPPMGYIMFCHRHAWACEPHGPIISRVTLTPARQAQLIGVNNFVNETIKPETDLQQYGVIDYWTYPKTAGDCEDYALLKRKLLIEDGWPESTLLMTVVYDENHQGHAVLTVRTNEGDLILDNKQPRIRLWRNTPYSYVERQSERNPMVWVSLFPPGEAPAVPIAASEGN